MKLQFIPGSAAYGPPPNINKPSLLNKYFDAPLCYASMSYLAPGTIISAPFLVDLVSMMAVKLRSNIKPAYLAQVNSRSSQAVKLRIFVNFCYTNLGKFVSERGY